MAGITLKNGFQTMKTNLNAFPAILLFTTLTTITTGRAAADGTKSNLSQAAQKRPPINEIVVCFKTHFDIGYTDLVPNVLKRYRTSFTDGALKLIDDSRGLPPDQQFVWTVPGWPLTQMAGQDQSPERRTKVMQALKDGRLAVHALPFSLETESLDLEDLVRGMEFSSRLCRSVGIDIPRAAKMTDVPCHTWIMPTLLKHAGVNFLHIGCNSGSHVMKVPLLFWWEGPDGSRLLTEYSPAYGTGLLPPANWPYKTWLAMIMTGDNQGPPTPAQVDDIRRRVAKEMPCVKLKFGKLEDFADAILAEKNDTIPVVRADMPDTWIHGFESMPIETKTGCNVRPLETAVASLDTHLKIAGITTPLLADDLAKAYENSVLYGEHTFGYHGGQPGGFWYGDEWKKKREEGRYKKFEQSFDDKRAYIHKAENVVKKAMRDRKDLLAKNVDVKGPRVVVFNALPWKRNGDVGLTVHGGPWSIVRDVDTGKEAPMLGSNTTTLFFEAIDVPPSGYKTYELVPGGKSWVRNPARASDTIENDWFRLRVDPSRGGMVSLIDKKTGRELIAANHESDVSQFSHERFALNDVKEFVQSYARNWGLNGSDFNKPGMPAPDKSPYAKVTLANWKMSVADDARSQYIDLECDDAQPLAKRMSISYTLWKDCPYLNITWIADDKTPNPIPEGGWLCLPFNIDHPQFRLGRVGSIIDPAKDIIPGGNRKLICLNSGMTITGPDGNGVGICPIDSPLVSLGEPGLWKYSDDYVPTKANVYINLYNNMWNTNFPLWQEGSWDSSVRIWAIHSNDNEKNLISPSWEARIPLRGAFADGPGGKLPPTATGLALSRRGVLLTAFGDNPDGEGTILRVWEQAGTAGELTVMLPAGAKFATATPVNLRGESEGPPLPISGGKFSFNLGAFAPASFVLK
jgi:hypothetical protein